MWYNRGTKGSCGGLAQRFAFVPSLIPVIITYRYVKNGGSRRAAVFVCARARFVWAAGAPGGLPPAYKKIFSDCGAKLLTKAANLYIIALALRLREC